VGRERLLQRVVDLLDVEDLVTLVGPGGVGKTALARELARSGASVLWGNLATPPATTVLQAPGEGPAVPLSQLTGHRGLVVLDEAELVVVEAALEVEALIARCPGVAVLVTSRVPLGVPGERVVAVERLRVEEAVQLLRQELVLSVGDEAAEEVPEGELVRAVHALDRLPLALGLAAAQARSLHLPDATAGALRDPSLQSAVGRSLAILPPRLQQAASDLTVFQARFFARHAEAVAGVTAADVGELVSAGLLERDDGRGHGFLTTTRGALRAAAAPADEVRRRYFDLLVAEAEAGVVLPWLDDVSVALAERAADPSAVEPCLRLVIATATVFNAIGANGTSTTRWGRVIARHPPEVLAALPPDLVVTGLSRIASAQMWLGPTEETTELLILAAEFLTGASSGAHRLHEGTTATGYAQDGRFEEGLALSLEGLAHGAEGLAAQHLHNVAGWCLLALGRPDEAMPHAERNLRDSRVGGMPAALLHSLMGVIQVHAHRSEHDAVLRLAREVAAIMRELGGVVSRWDVGYALATAARAHGDLELARRLVRQGDDIRRRRHPGRTVFYEEWSRTLHEQLGPETGLLPEPDPLELDEVVAVIDRLEGVVTTQRTGVRLTPRQREVLEAVSTGATSAAAARALGMTTRTLSKHLENAYAALGVNSRIAALAVLREASAG
jgi:DNA-binding CsgD family transcriptional regulator